MYETVDVVQKNKTLSKKQGIKITELLEKCELSKNALSSMNSRVHGFMQTALPKLPTTSAAPLTTSSAEPTNQTPTNLL